MEPTRTLHRGKISNYIEAKIRLRQHISTGQRPENEMEIEISTGAEIATETEKKTQKYT